MGFRMMPPRRVKKAKSYNSQEVLRRLKKYLDEGCDEPVRILCGFWKDQQNAITYQERRQAVKDGAIDDETLRLWQQDYSILVSDRLSTLWTDALSAGSAGQPILDDIVLELNMQRPAIIAWINERGAEFVTSCTQEQRDAIAALVAKKMRDNHTVDELARMIRPCIGLTASQAAANAKYYDNIVATLTKEHPRMSKDSIRKKALDASRKYAERQHRERALMIAQTESAFAYNRGADEGIRQAQEERLIGRCKKRWSTSGDDAVCEICASLEGIEIEMDESFDFKGRLLFTGQKLLPPAHPRCACAVQYIEVDSVYVPETNQGNQETRTIVEGKDISETFERRQDQFDFEIEDVLNAQGFDGLPRVVGKEEFDDAVKDSHFIAQRVYTAPSQEILDEYHKQLYEGKWYVNCSTGGANYGQGMYCAADYTGTLSDGIKAEMKNYQELYRKLGQKTPQPSRIETFTLHPSAKIVTYDEMQEMYNGIVSQKTIDKIEEDAVERLLTSIQEQYGENAYTYVRYRLGNSGINFKEVSSAVMTLGDDKVTLLDRAISNMHDEANNAVDAYRQQMAQKTEIIREKYKDIGSYAASLGYDAINAEGHGQSGSYTIILNRTKVIFLGG